VRTEKKEQGVEWWGLWAHWKWGLKRKFFFWTFQVKNAEFYAFLLQNTILVARNQDQGDLINPLGG